MNFGEYLKKKRVDLGLTLRDFCKKNNYDPGYISRLENCILPPPASEKKLKALGTALNIKTGSSDWKEFLTLASLARKEIPENLDSHILNFLPAFFRKASKKEISKEDVKKMVKLIKGEESA